MAATYTTRDGDQWDIIAKRVYGNELHADWLMENNGRYIGIYEFDAGTVLSVPPLPESKAAELPPWRK